MTTANELLEELLALFREKVPEADFLREWPGKPESRGRARPAVTGGIDQQTVKPGSEEVRYGFRIFLPSGAGAEQAEDLFAAMCAAAGERYPGFFAISRGGAGRDKVTGMLEVDCSLSFLTQTGGGTGAQGRSVVLGGREYSVTGVKTSVSRKGQKLVSIGETEPFAVLGGGTEYTVELEGLETAGLENLAAFTAEIDGETRYYNCRWKSLSDVLRKGVFISGQKREEA